MLLRLWVRVVVVVCGGGGGGGGGGVGAGLLTFGRWLSRRIHGAWCVLGEKWLRRDIKGWQIWAVNLNIFVGVNGGGKEREMVQK